MRRGQPTTTNQLRGALLALGLALGCGAPPPAAPCSAPGAAAAPARPGVDQRAQLWQREAARLRQVLAACRTGACFAGSDKRAKAVDPRLSRCLQPLEHEAEALAPSSSPYAYAAGLGLLERAEQCVAEPASSDDSPASRAIVSAEVQIDLANAEQATKLIEAAASEPAPAWQRARLLLARAGLADLQADNAAEETFSRQALELLENGSNRVLLGVAEQSRAHALGYLGRYLEARRALQRALALEQAALGEHSLSVASALMLEGWTWLEAMEPERARVLYQGALAIREATLGPEHPATALSWNGLGMVYSQLDDLAQASDALRRALRSCEARLGDAHPDVADILLNLANVYAYPGRVDVARRLAERSLRIAKATRGPDHPEVALSMSFVAPFGLVNDEPGTLEALQSARQALQQHIGAKHPNTAWATLRVAWGHAKRGDHAAARREAEAAERVFLEVWPSDSPVLLYPRRQLAVSLFALGEVTEAERVAALVMQTVAARHGAGSKTWHEYRAAFACTDRPPKVSRERCPAGTLLVTRAADGSDAKPDEVCLAPELVSVAEYRACVASKRCASPFELRDVVEPLADGDPIVGVHVKDAARFCELRGLRLPTSAEVSLARGSGRDCSLDARKQPLSQQGIHFYLNDNGSTSDDRAEGEPQRYNSSVRCAATPTQVTSTQPTGRAQP